MSSDAQIQANRRNAQLSTGPATPQGKVISSLNAVKTGLTGRTVLLPGDDAVAYRNHVQRLFDKHQPANDEEHALTQSVADTEWRLLRIPALELGIYALGRLEFASAFDEQDPSLRSALIDAQVFLTHQKQLNNLSIQEGRLRKQHQKDTAELKQLIEKRRQSSRNQLVEAARLCQAAKKENQPFDPAEFGFEFSLERIQEEAAVFEAMESRSPYFSLRAKAILEQFRRKHAA